MRALHDTRNVAYRHPFGATAVGQPVEMLLDVWDDAECTAVLRTWEDGRGEALVNMQLESLERHREANGMVGETHETGESEVEQVAQRFKVTLVADKPGVVWYQFIITDVEGRIWRYGVKNGCRGGAGQLVGWEPPSFQLTVFDPHDDAPAWYEPIGGYLYDKEANHDISEVAATLCENYPAALARTSAVWDTAEDEPLIPMSLPGMKEALTVARADACSWFAVGDDVFGFWRKINGSAMTCALFNSSIESAHDVAVPMIAEDVSELVAGFAVRIVSSGELSVDERFEDEADEAFEATYAMAHLWPVGCVIFHFHPAVRLASELEPGLGVLAHITSLPAAGEAPGALDALDAAGTLGASAYAFVDWLADAGMRYWQVLPVNPTDEFGSPYAGISAFAGNTQLLEGGEPTEEALSPIADEPEYREFCEQNADWLNPYACFMAIRAQQGEGVAWQEWPKCYRAYSPKLLGDAELEREAERIKRCQFLFDRQWRGVRAYANERGIQIVGDMPIYVSADSADVWAHPGLFQLNAKGLPYMVAGCPPDAFAQDGQVWGNPVYDWDAMRVRGYEWWLRRLERAFDLYDYVRLDHFIGFSRYFCIPSGEKASQGEYRLGPGFEFFQLAHEKFGKLPIIAEDLGLITSRVRALVASCGFYGMDIIQFVDGGDPLSGYVPRPEKVVYTGTHDNQTLMGYVRSRYPQIDERWAYEELLGKVVGCAEPVRMLPLQDILGLDDVARMNVPGVAEGNWAWRANADDIHAALGFARSLASAEK